jgi:hypothetical protein
MASSELQTARHWRLNPFFRIVWGLWPLCALYLWLLALYSVPPFLEHAAAGTLPTVVIDGESVAGMAAVNAAAWGVSVAGWSWINVLVTGLSYFVFTLVGGLIWWRVRSGFGLFTAYVLLIAGSSAASSLIYGAGLPDWATTSWAIGGLVWPLFFFWLYLFPDGAAVPRRLLWVIVPLLILFMTFFVTDILSGFLPQLPALAKVSAAILPYGFTVIGLLFLLVFGSQIYRYVRVSGPVEREQTKSFLLGLLIAILPLSIIDVYIDYPAELNALTFMALPLGIGIAVLRYRLWDVDVIIRKTLIYGLVTAVLIAVYFGLVLLAQAAFVGVTGQESPIAIVISTLVIAALFNPLRRRIQAFIDRRFYRRSYDAAQALAQFAQSARDEVEKEKLLADLTGVINETMRPQSLSLWLRGGSGSLTRDS